MAGTNGVICAIEEAEGWLRKAKELNEPRKKSVVLEAAEDPAPIDALFGPPLERRVFDGSEFVKVADGDGCVLIRKSERDLWALSEDGQSVVRLFDPQGAPLVMAKTASVEERDAIALFAGMARKTLVSEGLL